MTFLLLKNSRGFQEVNTLNYSLCIDLLHVHGLDSWYKLRLVKVVRVNVTCTALPQLSHDLHVELFNHCTY